MSAIAQPSVLDESREKWFILEYECDSCNLQEQIDGSVLVGIASCHLIPLWNPFRQDSLFLFVWLDHRRFYEAVLQLLVSQYQDQCLVDIHTAQNRK